MSGQTLTDRIAAAQYHVVGSAVSRSVCKASTHELMAPKKKHLDFLIQCTNETNVNIPQLADTLFERAMNSSWIVVFKALVATDHLMCNGNERFIQYLASRNTLFNLSNFLDKSGVQGYDMSTFVRRYSKYLNEKAYSYRQMAFDFTRVKRGNEGLMRSMNVEKLLKALPVLQGQVDALLDFDASPSDLSNGVINAAFSLLFKDMIRLFACYNDGVINLLEKFFELKKTQSKDALELYKKFLTRMTRVAEFFKIAEQIGIDKGDIPDIAQVLSTQVLHDLKLHGAKESPFKELTFETAPSSLLEAMEQHVAIQEAKKGKEGSTGRVASGGTGAAAPTTSSSPVSTPAQSIDTTAGGDVFLASSAPQVTSASNDLLGLQTDFLSAAEPLVQPASPSMGSWAADLLGGDMLSAPAAPPSPHPSRTPTPTLTATTSAAAQPPVGVPPVSEGEASSPPAEASAAGGAAAASPPSGGGGAVAPSSVQPSDVDLFGDVFASTLSEPATTTASSAAAAAAAKPGDGAEAAVDLFSDPFAPSAGSAGDAAPADLDLFAIKVALPEGAPDAAGVTLPLTPSPAAAVLTPSAPVPPLLTPTAPAAPAASVDLFAEAFIGTPSSTASPAKSESFASPAPAIDLLGDAFGSPTQGAVPICATSPAPDPFAALTLQPTSDPKSGCSSQQLDFDMFGAQAAPIAPTTILPAAATAPFQEASGFDLIGDMLLPSMQQQQPQMQPQVLGHVQQATGKLVANDLDSSLANLVGNLGISSPAKKGQWSGGEKKLTGGANWQPRAAPPAWAPAPAAPAPAMAPGAMAGVPLMGPAPAMFGPTSAQTGMRPPFGSMGTAQLSPSPTPVSQSPQKGPTKDPLADLNLKDFI
ncbi:clathrin coat assembly protein AP180-like isoform X6 [Lethenteron reissneri]|uniref:clathrin coat assembly protein AP180-like isoform X6 n=1 Tax=Lethenteron reissneri TaxID=7753 RepID=UPI002AB73DB3|nr:clathrin coat assembly protein AP180-like isoform X6 [Lethenteron reissneri]